MDPSPAINHSLLPAKVSERQARILLFMMEHHHDFGFYPTVREIGDATGIGSTSVVTYNLNRLVMMGYLTPNPPGKSRAYVLREPAYQLIDQVCPDARRDSLQPEMLRLQRENTRLREVYEAKLRRVQRERDQLAAKLAALEQERAHEPQP